MEKNGILALVNLSDKESDLFLDYLRKSSNTPAYDFINYLIGKDYIMFLDLLAGVNLKISSRKSLYRDMEYIKIYIYVRDHGFNLDSMKCAAKIYNKKLSFVKRAVAKVSKTVEGVANDCINDKDGIVVVDFEEDIVDTEVVVVEEIETLDFKEDTEV
jgi:hypothetical protein